jgi:integrase
MPRKTFRKIITDDELILQINKKNKNMADLFLKEKDTRSSSATIKGYQSDLNIFFVWNLLENDNKFFIDIKKIEFANFFNYCINELQWNSARFNRMRSCLSSLSLFIERFFDDDYPNFRNVILKVVESMPKILVREKTIFSDEQINGLLKHLSDNRRYQEACWLALAISSGARFSELLRFTTDIIDENNVIFEGIFIEASKKIKTKGRTKSGKMLTKYIIKDIFIPYYKKWLEERNPIMYKNNKEHNYIFIKKDGSPANEYDVRYWISDFEEFLKVPFYPHSLRHYSSTYLARIGIPSQLIKELFGWESVDMVELYNDTEIKDREWKELENLREHLNKNYN